MASQRLGQYGVYGNDNSRLILPISQACAGAGGAAVGVIHQPWTAISGAVDDGLLFLRAETRKSLKRILGVILALTPVLMLLVGSCKTSELPGAYGSMAGPEQFRTALFPDRVNFKGIEYYPAEGYIARAQKFVSGDPDTLKMLTMREITYLFGAPARKRNDANAEVWQYKGNRCVVDFYFYHQGDAKSAASVDYVDVRSTDMHHAQNLPDGDQTSCLKKVIDHGDFKAGNAPARI